ncbi:hypothetical protein FFI16_021560 [Pseudomonas sp. KBS0710]|nr:hypothetical protein FFI16_021560 [Pseudomonas sp. KBS0710]
MWERACSRRGPVSWYMCWLTNCFREQARSHIDLGIFERVITGMSSAYRPWAMALSISQFSEGPRSLVTSTGRPA